MSYIETLTVQPQLIAIDKLEKSPLNVRKTMTQAGIDEMKASILSHGLIQNLNVTAARDGIYHVVTGARRLEAIRQLQDEDKLPGDFAVPCRVVTEEEAAEMSLAENTVRLAMHPADEFEAFAELIENGHSADQVALRFGVEESIVLKRMKLARVAPELLQAYREGDISLECLMAFTITDDRMRQLKVYQSLQDWQKDDPRHIRGILTEALVDADSKLARFVGLDTYEAAGGTTRRDLFGDEVYLENPELLDALVVEKLRLVEQELKTEGWGWVEVSPERDWTITSACGRIRPQPADAPQALLDRRTALEAELATIEQYYENAFGDDQDDAEQEATEQRQSELEAELVKLESELESFAAYDPEQMSTAGCYVSIGHDGNLSVEKGLVRRQDMNHQPGLDKAKERKPKGMPETLRRDLEAYRLQVAQNEIARHPDIAFDLLVFNVACGVFDHVSPDDGPDVHFRQSNPRPGVEAETVAAERLEALSNGFPVGIFEEENEASRFDAFRKLNGTEKLDILAYCVALTLKPKLAPVTGDEATAYDLALSMTGASVAGYWRPNKSNYLSRITRDQLLAIGRDVLGEPWAQSRWKDKKGELVDQLDRAFSAPGQSGRTPEQTEKLQRWLPAGMTFDGIADLSLAEAEQAREAA